MRVHTSLLEDKLKDMRELDAVISYKSNTGYYVLTTQNDEPLLTSSGLQLWTEQGTTKVSSESLNSVNPLFNVSLFKSVCKSVEIDSKEKIEQGTWINLKIGVKILGDEYEYLDFGNYYIQDEPTYQADSESYLITAYDKMVESMVEYDLSSVSYPITLKDYLIKVCERLGWNYSLDDMLVNTTYTLQNDVFANQDLTYRDVLDYLSEVFGCSLQFDVNDNLIAKYFTKVNLTNYTIDEDMLKNVNVDISKKVGPINELLVTSESDSVIYSKRDEESITTNGLTSHTFENNPVFLQDTTQILLQSVFALMSSVEYYVFDFDTIGLLVLEPMDYVNVSIYGTLYPTHILNDDIKLTTGLVETIYDEMEEDTTDNNTVEVSNKSEKKINNALVKIDKANAQIVLKVDSNGKIAKVELNGDADGGATINIDADQLNLTANDIINLIANNSINLTSKNITINSTNFNVDKDGNMTANSGTFGGTINTSKDATVGNNLYVGQNQASSAVDMKYLYFNSDNYIKRVYSNAVSGLEMYGKNYSRIKVGDTKLEAMDDQAKMETSSGGSFYINGSNIYASSEIIVNSDARLKDEIKEVDVNWIDDLNVKQYEYKNNIGIKHIGLIAQDCIDKKGSEFYLRKRKIDNEEYYSIAYENITNGLVKYCQELKKEVEELKEEISIIKEGN